MRTRGNAEGTIVPMDKAYLVELGMLYDAAENHGQQNLYNVLFEDYDDAETYLLNMGFEQDDKNTCYYYLDAIEDIYSQSSYPDPNNPSVERPFIMHPKGDRVKWASIQCFPIMKAKVLA